MLSVDNDGADGRSFDMRAVAESEQHESFHLDVLHIGLLSLLQEGKLVLGSVAREISSVEQGILAVESIASGLSLVKVVRRERDTRAVGNVDGLAGGNKSVNKVLISDGRVLLHLQIESERGAYDAADGETVVGLEFAIDGGGGDNGRAWFDANTSAGSEANKDGVVKGFGVVEKLGELVHQDRERGHAHAVGARNERSDLVPRDTMRRSGESIQRVSLGLSDRSLDLLVLELLCKSHNEVMSSIGRTMQKDVLLIGVQQRIYSDISEHPLEVHLIIQSEVVQDLHRKRRNMKITAKESGMWMQAVHTSSSSRNGFGHSICIVVIQ